MLDEFSADALHDVSELRELYDPPSGLAARKQIDWLDDVARRLIAVSPFVLVASAATDGRCDVTPRGGPPGFVTVLDDHHLAIPDATGNRRLDTLRNVIETGHVGLLFVIGGRNTTLRVNGPACVTTSPSLLDRLQAVGKPPRSAIVVEAAEVYAHCPKSFVRAALWQPDSWPTADQQPSPAEVTLAHVADPELTLADVEASQAESLRSRFL